MSDARRLLFITFDFPPRRTSGVYRMRSLAKYLWAERWNPTVLTVQGPVALWSAAELIHDDTLLEGLPTGVEIVRTPYFNLQAWEGIHPRHTLRAPTQSEAPRVPASVSRPSIVGALARRIAAWVRSVLYFPDPSSGWIPHALLAAIRLHRTHRFTAILTSSPPRAAHVVGLCLKLALRIPWTADFMDPWYPPRGAIRRGAEHWLLRAILRHADRVVVVNEGHLSALRSEFGLSLGHLTVIPNGFDEDNFPPHTPSARRANSPVIFTHVGTIYPGFSGRFFEAVSQLIDESPQLAAEFHIEVIGVPDSVTTAFAASEVGMKVVTLHGYKPQGEAIQAMLESDGLLLFLADEDVAREAISSKIYEYLRAGPPILAVTFKGGVQDLIERSGAGIVVHPDNIDAMKTALRKIIVERMTPVLSWREFADQFRYDRLARRLAVLLEESR